MKRCIFDDIENWKNAIENTNILNFDFYILKMKKRVSRKKIIFLEEL